MQVNSPASSPCFSVSWVIHLLLPVWCGWVMAWTSALGLASRNCSEFSRKHFLSLNCYEISVRWGRSQGQRFGAPGRKISLVLPVCVYLIKYRKGLPLSHPHSAYPEPWSRLEWTPDGSCGCSEHKRFLVCSRVYQCLNRTGGSTGTPYQQLIGAHGFPGTLLVPWVYPAPSALS